MVSNIHYNRSRDEKGDLIEDEHNLSPVMRKPLETGESQRSLDNEHLISFLNGVEANPYFDAFYAVLSQVSALAICLTVLCALVSVLRQ